VKAPSVHASALVVGESGVLVRGPSGAGKSLLTLAMVASARAAGNFAALVADDRVFLELAAGRVLARPAAGFGGLVERRGEGLLTRDYEPRAVLRLVIDLFPPGQKATRLPEASEREVELLGVTLPRLALDLAPGLQEGAYAGLREVGRVAVGARRFAERIANFA
jgi:serine kinase of HPr protein (carbohydrate metabolism regulator)